jgi:hypothetical protein
MLSREAALVANATIRVKFFGLFFMNNQRQNKQDFFLGVHIKKCIDILRLVVLVLQLIYFITALFSLLG